MPDPKIYDNPKARVQEAQTKNPELYRELSVYGEEAVASPTSSQYDTSLVEGISVEQQRAEAQGIGSKLLNTVGGGLLKAIPSTIGTVANILDLENYGFNVTGAKEDEKGNFINDYDNWLTKSMNELNKKTEEVTPIYGSSSEFGTLGNAEWWMNMAKSTIDSGGSFALTGLGVGAALRGVARAGAGALSESIAAANELRQASQLSKGGGLLGETFGAANKAAITAMAEGTANLSTSALLTHAEGVQLAAGVFDNAYGYSYSEYIKDNPGATHEQAQDYALHKASDAAATAHHVNMINTLLNITSINRMFTPTAYSREAAKKMTMSGLIKEWGHEGIQEYAEENINNIAENIALNQAKSKEQEDNTKLVLDSIFSQEGLEAGIGGMFGGIFQSAVTDLKKGVTGEFKQQNIRYAEAQKNLIDLEKHLNSVEGQQSVKTILNKANYTVDKINQINNLAIQGKDAEANIAKKELLQYQLFQAFKVGNGAQAEQFLKEALDKLPSEERADAHKVLAEFKEAEKVYNETVFSQPLNKQEDVYFNRLNDKNLTERERDLRIDLTKAEGDLANKLSLTERAHRGQPVALDNPGLIPYREKVAEIQNELNGIHSQLLANDLHYTSILDGSHYVKKAAEKAQKVQEDVKKAEEQKYEDSKQKHQDSVENPVTTTKTTTTTEAKTGVKETETKTQETEAPTTKAPGVTETAPGAPVVLEDIFGKGEAEEALTGAEKETKPSSEIEVKKTEIEGKRAKALESIEFAKSQNPNVDFTEDINKINAKYDAELKALEKPVEQPKAEKIEDDNIPTPKKLGTEESKEFKEDLSNNSKDSFDEDSIIDQTNPQSAIDKNDKQVNGFSAVGYTSVLAEVKDGKWEIQGLNLDNVNQNNLSSNGKVDSDTPIYITHPPKTYAGAENPLGENAQFNISLDPEGIEVIGHVHLESWCNKDTIADSDRFEFDNIKRNKEEVKALRISLVNQFSNGATSVATVITSKSSGKANFGKEKGSVSQKTDNDERVILAVIKKDGYYVNSTKAEDFLADRNQSTLDYKADPKFFSKYEGMTVMLVPGPRKSGEEGAIYQVVFTEGNSIPGKDIQDSIKHVISAYLKNDGATLAEYGVENTRNAVQSYINNFYYTSSTNDKKRNPYYFTVDEGKLGRNFKANKIDGTQPSVLNINKGTQNLGSVLDEVIQGRPFNVSLRSNETGAVVNILKEGVITPMPYTTIAKDNIQTTLEPMVLKNVGNEKAYFNNPVLQFSPKLEPVTGELTAAEEVENNEEKVPGTVAVKKTKPKKDDNKIFKPNPGKKTSSASPLEILYEIPGMIPLDKVSEETAQEYMDTTRVNDVTDLMYNFITEEYLKNNVLSPRAGFRKFQAFVLNELNYYSFFGDPTNEIEASDIEEGALLTHEENALRAADWQQVYNLLPQFAPLVAEKLNQTGFKIKNLNIETLFTQEQLELEQAITKEELEQIIEEENEVEKEKFDASSFETDPMSGLSAKMKAFLKSIKSERINYLGGATFADFQNLHNKIMGILANKFLTYNEIIKELTSYAEYNPEIAQVIEKLRETDVTLRNQFTTHFYKEHIELVMVKEEKTFNTNRETQAEVTLSAFSSGIENKTSETKTDGLTYIKHSEESEKLYDKANDNPTIENVKAYLDSIGVEVTLNTLQFMKDNMGTKEFNKEYFPSMEWQFNFGKKINQKSNSIFENIRASIVNAEGKAISEDPEATVKDTIFKKEQAFKKLARIESMYRDSDISPSTVNGQGKTIFGFTLPNPVAIKLNKLKKNVNGVVDALKEISFSKYASWLDQTGNHNFKIFYFDVNNQTGNKDYAKPFHELSEENKARTRINLFTNIFGFIGEKNVTTRFISSAKSDKTKAQGIEYTKFNIGFTGHELNKATMDQLVNIGMAEYYRILKAQENPNFKEISGYNPSLFYIFPTLNNITEIFGNGKVLKFEGDVRPHIEKEIRRIVNDEIAFTKERLVEYGIIGRKGEFLGDGVNADYKNYVTNNKPGEVNGKEMPNGDYLATDFVVNQFLANYNYMALFSGDPALYYKKSKKFNPSKVDHVMSSLDNMFKRLAKEVAPAQRLANFEKSVVRQIFIKDPNKAFGQDAKLSKNFVQVLSLLDGITLEEYNNLTAKQKRELKSFPYSEIDIADAQEYTTISEHLMNLYNEGELDVDTYKALMTKIRTANRLKVDPTFTKEELTTLLKPVKPLYVHSNPDVLNNVDHHTYIKSSSIPLIPELTKGTKLDNLRKAMEKNGIHRAAMMSAAKVGAVNPLDINDITPDADLKNAVSLLSREGFGIQQPVPYDETKTEILQGSQIQKFIFEGVRHLFPELAQQFDTYQMNLMDEGFESLVKDLSITVTPEGTWTIPPGAPMAKFTELLKEELKSRNYNPNDLDSLKLDENGELAIPLWFNANAKRMESLILSLFTNRICKQKLPGQSYALASELGTEEDLTSDQRNDLVYSESYNPEVGLLPQRIVDRNGQVITDPEVLNFIKNMSVEELNERQYKVLGSQVFLPFDFRDNDGNLLNIEDFTKIVNGRKVIDTKKLPKELLEVIGYRIPTQGHNSMAFIEVVGFLPSYMVKSVIASKDFTKQMGSDFDIDKLYIHSNITHYFEDSGKLVESNKEVAKNGIVNTYKKVLSDPRVLHKILKPLDFGELENVKDELTKLPKFKQEPRSILSPWQQDKNFATGTAGKDGVGLTSLLSTLSSLLQNKNVSINPIVVQVGKDILPLTDISNPTSLSGRPKIDIISAFQSASVDNIKELLLDTINYNEHTHSALTTLSLLGLDEYFISYLFTQDSVKNYIKTRENDPWDKSSAVDMVVEQMKAEKLLQEDSDVQALLEDLEILSQEKLFANLKNPLPANSLEYFKRQLAIAKLFDDATNSGIEIGKLQSVVNTYTAGFTNNTMDLSDKLSKIDNISGINNYQALLGNEKGDKDKFGLTPVISTTPAGLGYELGRRVHSLMNQFFPVSSPLVKQTAESLGFTTKNTRKKLFDFIKSSLITQSNIINKPGIETILDLRRRLLFGENSLAHRWEEYKKLNPFNILGKRIECKTSNNERYPSTIKYLLTSGTRSDDFDIVKTLVEMLNNPQTTNLAEDTIKYLLMNGGIQLPNNFVKLIPNDYLIKNGFAKNVMNIASDPTAAEMLHPILVKQYIQHNPEEVQLIKNITKTNTLVKEDSETWSVTVVGKEKEVIQKINKLDKNKISVFSKKTIGHFITTIEKIDDNEVLCLWEKSGDFDSEQNPIYQRIPVLGKQSVVEASIDNYNTISAFPENNPETVIATTPEIPTGPVVENPNAPINSAHRDLGMVNEGKGIEYIKSVLDNIAATSKYKQNVALAKVLSALADKLPKKISMRIDTPYQNGKEVAGLYTYGNYAIQINPKLAKKYSVETVVMHEILHAFLVDTIDGKVELSPEGKRALTSLKRLFESAKEKYLKANNKTDIDPGNISEYGFLDIHEFINGAFETDFQKTLSSIQHTSEQSILERLKKLLSELVKSLIPNISEFHKVSGVNTSLIDEVIANSITLINEVQTKEIPTGSEEGIAFEEYTPPVAPPSDLFEGFLTPEQERDLLGGHASILEATMNGMTAEEMLAASDENPTTSKLDTYIDDFNRRVKTIKNAAFNEKNKLKQDELYKRAKVLEKQIDTLKTHRQISDLMKFAKENLKYVREKLSSPNLTTKDFEELHNYVNIFYKFKDHLLSEQDKQQVEDVTEKGEVKLVFKQVYKDAQKIDTLYERVFDELQSIEKRVGQKSMNKDLGTNVTVEDMYSPQKDIDFAQSQGRTSAMFANKILSWLNSIRVFAAKRAERETNDKLSMEKELFNKIKDLPIFSSMGWKLFIQEGSQRNLVNEYSAQYWKENSQFYENLKSGNASLIKKALNWYKANMTIIDPNRFVDASGINQTKLDAYRQEVIAEFGFEKGQELVNDALNKYQLYLLNKDQKIEEIQNTPDIDEKTKRVMLSDWDIANSPLLNIKRMQEGGVTKLSDGSFPRYSYWEYMTARPKDNGTNYDANYKIIASNPDLKAYHDFANQILQENFQMLPESFIANNKIRSNLLPYVERTSREARIEDGAMSMLHACGNWFVNKTSDSKESNIITTEIDKSTGSYNRSLPIRLFTTGSKVYNEETKQMEDDLSNFSLDLSHIMKQAIPTFSNYKHKSLVEDKVLFARRQLEYVEEKLEKERTKGEKTTDETGLKFLKTMADFELDIFYDIKNKKEYVTDKKNYTQEDKDTIAEYDKAIEAKTKELETANPLQQVALKGEITKLEEAKKAIGRNYSFGQIVRSLLTFNALKTQAFNVIGPFVELVGGNANLFAHASSGLDYNKGELGAANKLIYSFDKKTRNIIRRFNIVQHTGEVDEGALGKTTEILTYLNSQTDVKLRGTNSIAVMLNIKVDPSNFVDGQERSFYEILDEEGNPMRELFTEEGWEKYNPEADYVNDFYQVDRKIKTLNDKLFGAYDPQNPMRMKRTIAGAAIAQFKTFIVEGWYSRTEAYQEYNPALMRTVKGRYLSYGELFKEKTFKQGAFEFLKGMVFSKEAFANMSDIDRANMKKNIVEIYILMGSVATAQLLAMALAGDDDDENTFSALNLLLNATMRVQSDLLYYINPSEAKSITERIVPLFQVQSDIVGIFDATFKMFQGDFEMKTGVYKGWNRFLKEGAELMPVSAALLKLYKQSHEIIKKQ